MSQERSPTGSTGDSRFNMVSSGAVSPQGFGKDLLFEDIQFGEVVGRGAFGVVNKAIWKDMQVAVKTMEGKDAAKALNKEFVQLSRLQHENIVRLYGVCAKKPKVCLLMEYAEDGSLYDLLHPSSQDVRPCDYTIGHVISWALQCARAMEYLHGLKPTPIVHRDLKPPNMLLKERGTVIKICDFGTARPHDTSHMTSNKGSAPWMAPEVFEGPVYSEKCDVFSFSVVLWEMISRRKPFENIGHPPYRIMWAVHSGTRPPLIRGTPKILEDLMICGWSKNTEIRPPFTAIVRFLEKVSKYVTGGNIPLTITKTTARRESDSNSSYETQSETPEKTLIDIYEDEEKNRNESVLFSPSETPAIENEVIQPTDEKAEKLAPVDNGAARKKSLPKTSVASMAADLPRVPIDSAVDKRPGIAPPVAQSNLPATVTMQQQAAHSHEGSMRIEAVGPAYDRLHTMYPPPPQEFLPRQPSGNWIPVYDTPPSSYSQLIHSTKKDESDFTNNYGDIRPAAYRSPYRQVFPYDSRYYKEGTRLQSPNELLYHYTEPTRDVHYVGPVNDYHPITSFTEDNVPLVEDHFPRISPRPPYPQPHDPVTSMPTPQISADPRRFFNAPAWNNRLHPDAIPEHPSVNELLSRIDAQGQQFVPITPGSSSERSSAGSSPMTSPYQHTSGIRPNISTPTTQFEKKLWYLIDPEVMPVKPFFSHQESLIIYDQHTKLFNEYVELQNEMTYLIGRKRDLEQQLNNEKTEQQRSSLFLEDYLKLLEEKHSLATFLSGVKEQLKLDHHPRWHKENVL
ncbi:mitogen-activated protein kinase kinase kinase 7-like [Rhopilema esculentum]|uniref:mitogen-activated protein kinase kinase kinase 7-like n=1 Tax=Rhopilema esculentum TaxID=499914 RepID=UPI0031D94FE8